MNKERCFVLIWQLANVKAFTTYLHWPEAPSNSYILQSNGPECEGNGRPNVSDWMVQSIIAIH